MLETSGGKFHLTSRESCCVESAALHHVTGTVTVYNVNGDFNVSDDYDRLLSDIPNVHLSRLDAGNVFENTPLNDWYHGLKFNRSCYPTEHLSDALRLVFLWKFGGIYMDTDSVVIRSFQYFRNVIGFQGDGVANGLLIFDQNSPFIFQYMVEFARDYDPESWSGSGPMLASKVLQKFCEPRSIIQALMQPELCRGIRIFPPVAFYPINYWEWEKMFGSDTSLDLSWSFSVHLFGKMSRNNVSKVGNGSLIEKLFRDNCPKSFQLMKMRGYV